MAVQQRVRRSMATRPVWSRPARTRPPAPERYRAAPRGRRPSGADRAPACPPRAPAGGGWSCSRRAARGPAAPPAGRPARPPPSRRPRRSAAPRRGCPGRTVGQRRMCRGSPAPRRRCDRPRRRRSRAPAGRSQARAAAAARDRPAGRADAATACGSVGRGETVRPRVPRGQRRGGGRHRAEFHALRPAGRQPLRAGRLGWRRRGAPVRRAPGPARQSMAGAAPAARLQRSGSARCGVA